MQSVEDLIIINEQVKLSNYLLHQNKEEIIEEIFNGLNASQKYISSHFFYDRKGSNLFELITTLPEYYLTRIEKTIIKEVASTILGDEASLEIVDLGSGDYRKISILLDTMSEERIRATKYYPIDISEAVIRKSSETLVKNYPGLQIHGHLADFMKHQDFLPGGDNRVICFFGSTMGNFSREHAVDFLTGLKNNMHQKDTLLVGLDMVKDTDILEAAYNDDQGITEAFNRNILTVINDICQTNLFPGSFKHIAFYDEDKMRIEMHLEAFAEMKINSPFFPHAVHINKGETIHTENSHKFTTGLIHNMAEKSGLKIRDIFTDKEGWFSLVQFYAND